MSLEHTSLKVSFLRWSLNRERAGDKLILIFIMEILFTTRADQLLSASYACCCCDCMFAMEFIDFSNL